jgi:hypothetical protein
VPEICRRSKPTVGNPTGVGETGNVKDKTVASKPNPSKITGGKSIASQAKPKSKAKPNLFKKSTAVVASGGAPDDGDDPSDDSSDNDRAAPSPPSEGGHASNRPRPGNGEPMDDDPLGAGEGRMYREEYQLALNWMLHRPTVPVLGEFWEHLCKLKWPDETRYRIGRQEDTPKSNKARRGHKFQIITVDKILDDGDDGSEAAAAQLQQESGSVGDDQGGATEQERAANQGRTSGSKDKYHRILIIVCRDKQWNIKKNWEDCDGEDDCNGESYDGDVKMDISACHPDHQEHLPIIAVSAIGDSFAVWESWKEPGLARRQADIINIKETIRRIGMDEQQFQQRNTEVPWISRDEYYEQTQDIEHQYKEAMKVWKEAMTKRKSKQRTLPKPDFSNSLKPLWPLVRLQIRKTWVANESSPDILHEYLSEVSKNSHLGCQFRRVLHNASRRVDLGLKQRREERETQFDREGILTAM